MEHVFAQLKAFKILTNTFALDQKRLSTCYRAVAVGYNLNLAAKNAGIPKFQVKEALSRGMYGVVLMLKNCIIAHQAGLI